MRDITEQKVLDLKLREEKLNAEEMNVTLRNVLKSIENDRKEFEQKLTERISSSILPGIEKSVWSSRMRSARAIWPCSKTN